MFSTDFVVAQARSWVGTPYRHHGRTKGSACDCVGLIVGVGEELGLSLYQRFDYSDHPSADMLLTETGAVLNEVWKPEDGPVQLVAGNVVAVCVRDAVRPQHLAIIGEYAGRLTLIHAFNKHNRVVEHSIHPWWVKRIVRAYEYPGVDYGGTA